MCRLGSHLINRRAELREALISWEFRGLVELVPPKKQICEMNCNLFRIQVGDFIREAGKFWRTLIPMEFDLPRLAIFTSDLKQVPEVPRLGVRREKRRAPRSVRD